MEVSSSESVLCPNQLKKILYKDKMERAMDYDRGEKTKCKRERQWKDEKTQIWNSLFW